jgi:hypothetical protein
VVFFFDFKKVFMSKNKEFANMIVTDGLSASVLVSSPKSPDGEFTQTLQEQASQLFKSASRIVAVDPGRNPVFTAVVHDVEAMSYLKAPESSNTKHEVIKWTKQRFYHEAGYTHRNRITKLWTNKAPHIKALNKDKPSPKTSYLEVYDARISHVLKSLDEVLGFYSAQRFKRLKWKPYIRTQQAYEKIVADLKGIKPKKAADP